MTPTGWQFWIDRGGTFTDVIGVDPFGKRHQHKLLSRSDAYEDAVIQGIRDVMRCVPGQPLPESEIETLKMGTTVGTNALLERKGVPTCLVTTQGFADALAIGYQNRSDLFRLEIRKTKPLYQWVIEVKERLASDGTVLLPVDTDDLRSKLKAVLHRGCRSLAVVLLHAYRNPHHEVMVAKLAREAGFDQIVMSHEISRRIRFVARGDTTVLDAYLSDVLRQYLSTIRCTLPNTRIWMMKSNGGLVEAEGFRGKDSLLSGPAAGIVGASRVGEALGFSKIISFDMGGTSTDVAAYDAGLERVFESEVAGIKIRVPTLRIHTIAAGGGSILHAEGRRFLVGPDSAGAHPGPACYRNGGPLTLTDCNVLVGKIIPQYFPKIFGANHDLGLDVALVRSRFGDLAEEIRRAGGPSMEREEIAHGFIRVAVENMANAIKEVSIQRGLDVRTFALCSFGGAGGQHACMVAEALGISTVFIHPMAGLLSALGLGLSDLNAIGERTVEQPFDEGLVNRLEKTLVEMDLEVSRRLIDQGASAHDINLKRTAHLRYAGSDHSLGIPFGSFDEMKRDLETAFHRQFGFVPPDRKMTVAEISVEGTAQLREVSESDCSSEEQTRAAEPLASTELYGASGSCPVPVYDRTALPERGCLEGPCVIVEHHSTTVVEKGWEVSVAREGVLILRHLGKQKHEICGRTEVDPVQLEIFNNLFTSMAEHMGVVLQRTSMSVNIKERLDFSCALFDESGGLVANAPHIPVHLGSMDESVTALISKLGSTMKPGDVFATNDPFSGGTHLPDITVITPVFCSSNRNAEFYLASRGHHADVGGRTPGSMPPDSTTLSEEGVLFDAVRIVADGKFLDDSVREILNATPYPARSPNNNVADLQAQIAANEKGRRALHDMLTVYPLDMVKAYMKHIQTEAEMAVRGAIGKLRSGSFRVPLDVGGEIVVSVAVDPSRGNAVVDFSGTSCQMQGNFNAPASITKAAVLYVFRTLVAKDIPLNSGCLVPIRIVLPAGSLVAPEPGAAVAAGNVETSQLITDALLGALGVLAGSQGTMNNFSIGTDEWQYYETLCGGAGAGPGFEGADAVHTHMTNSRLTDPEVLELRFPVRIRRFAVRSGSGGSGRFCGGNGAVRELEFLEPMTAALLSSRRHNKPFGLSGGLPGKSGKTTWVRADGQTRDLGGLFQVHVKPNDVLIIETPGGGGFGKA